MPPVTLKNILDPRLICVPRDYNTFSHFENIPNDVQIFASLCK